MKKETVRASYAYNLIYQVFNVLLPLATTPYVSRVLGSEGIGIYSFTYSLVSTFVMIGSLGVGTYGQREIATVNEEPLNYSLRFFEIQIVKTVAVMLSAACFFLMAIATPQYTTYFLIQLPYFVSAILDISWFYQGMEQFKRVAIRNIIIKIASLISIFLFVKTREDLMIYMMILCMSQVVGNLAMWVTLKRDLVSVKGAKLCPQRHIKAAFVYFIPTISYQIYAVLDKTMLGVITQDASENGFYEQAHKLVNMVTMFIASYTIVMRSKMTSLFAKNDHEKIHAHFDRSMRFIGLLVFPMSFGMWAVAGNLVPWFFGEGFDRVVDLLRVFSPYFILMGICTGIGTHILTPSGQQNRSNIGQCIAAITNVVVNLMLIPRLGAVGAAAASVISEATIVVAYMHYVPEYLTYHSILSMNWKLLCASVIMSIPTYFLAERISPTPVNTILCVVLGAVVYVLALLILREDTLTDLFKKSKR